MTILKVRMQSLSQGGIAHVYITYKKNTLNATRDTKIFVFSAVFERERDLFDQSNIKIFYM